ADAAPAAIARRKTPARGGYSHCRSPAKAGAQEPKAFPNAFASQARLAPGLDPGLRRGTTDLIGLDSSPRFPPRPWPPRSSPGSPDRARPSGGPCGSPHRARSADRPCRRGSSPESGRRAPRDPYSCAGLHSARPRPPGTRSLGRPRIGDRAQLGFRIAGLAQVTESEVVQGVGGGAGLLEDREAALELLRVLAPERDAERMGAVARFLVEAMLGGRCRRVG